MNVFYQWQRLFFENVATAFERTTKHHRCEDVEDRQIAQLQAKLAQKHDVISEMMEENIGAKKNSMGSSERSLGSGQPTAAARTAATMATVMPTSAISRRQPPETNYDDANYEP